MILGSRRCLACATCFFFLSANFVGQGFTIVAWYSVRQLSTCAEWGHFFIGNSLRWRDAPDAYRLVVLFACIGRSTSRNRPNQLVRRTHGNWDETADRVPTAEVSCKVGDVRAQSFQHAYTIFNARLRLRLRSENSSNVRRAGDVIGAGMRDKMRVRTPIWSSVDGSAPRPHEAARSREGRGPG